MSQHTPHTQQSTPGPWIHNPSPEPQNADRHICVNIPSGFARVIARVKHTAVDDALANARLIAKAPEMLALLKEFMAMYDGIAAPFANTRALLREIEGK